MKSDIEIARSIELKKIKQVAEGVGVIPREPGTDAVVPYEVAEVVKRGFVNSEGQVLRKAEVITYREV